ncbi:MAG TPA: 23S rRNA (uracil(1939)-C(5))-methyltransferase RlmD [Gammaproteobacteria bacterium]|nr:23S rRNA (uracil(1939)-C(5))-methyltransferase RlmD [Gammaproteobacteria bacterium]
MAKRRRRQKLPQDPIQVTIESLSHEGRGIAKVEGKTVFVDGGLTDEVVTCRYTKIKKHYDEAIVTEVISASPDRVTAPCTHFGVCGGCSLMHMAPQAQLELKQKTLAEQLQHFGQLQPQQWLQALTGPVLGYRRKARLGVKYIIKKERLVVGFREKRSPYLALLDSCSVLDPRVGQRLADLSRLVATLSIYDQIAQIEVAMDDTQVALVWRHLAPLSLADKEKMIAFAKANQFMFYLQSGGPDTVTPLWPEQGQLHYQPETGIDLQFSPNDFTQVNASVNEKMLQQAMTLLALSSEDKVLDLFCGLGNFTLPIARRVKQVIGVEGDASLVQHAKENAWRNDLQHVQFELADLTQIALQDYPWAQGGFDKVLLDPPRSGALEVMSQLAALKVKRIVYVSCNPATLARDTGVLVNEYGYQLIQAGIMDMFPHTSHVESMAVLTLA